MSRCFWARVGSSPLAASLGHQPQAHRLSTLLVQFTPPLDAYYPSIQPIGIKRAVTPITLNRQFGCRKQFGTAVAEESEMSSPC